MLITQRYFIMIILIAVGNRLMMDDGVALAVAERLEERLRELNIKVIFSETDCESSLFMLNEDDFVIILDAMCTGAQPGSVSFFSLEETKVQLIADSQHDLGIIELIKLYNLRVKGYFVGIEAAEIGIGDELSPQFRDKLPQICSHTEKAIVNIMEIHQLMSTIQ